MGPADPDTSLEQLVREHAALRRVATLVAREPSPAEVFEAVAREVGTLLGASRAQIFTRVVLMCALPSLAVGIRLGLGFAFLALVAAELIASTAGLGYLIMDSRLTFQTDRGMVGIVSLGILGFVINGILVRLERWALAWKQDINAADVR